MIIDDLKCHDLKCWPEPFEALRTGKKTCEVRKDDRGYKTGDILVLHEFDPKTSKYTASSTQQFFVTHITRGFGLPEGLIVMSVRRMKT